MEIAQFFGCLDTEIIVNKFWIEDITYKFPIKYSQFSPYDNNTESICDLFSTNFLAQETSLSLHYLLRLQKHLLERIIFFMVLRSFDLQPDIIFAGNDEAKAQIVYNVESIVVGSLLRSDPYR